MEREQLISTLTQWSDAYEIEAEGQFVNLRVPPSDLHKVAERLKNEKDFLFDYMFCLTGVDWPTHLEVVYHLESTLHKHQLVLRVNTEDRETPNLDTLCDLYPTAEPHEREVYDLLGIVFNNHPDLRRILLDDDWVGYPLRKDYNDDVNLIVK
jgi:NADH/F420H2 dehydrogenase subunit C